MITKATINNFGNQARGVERGDGGIRAEKDEAESKVDCSRVARTEAEGKHSGKTKRSSLKTFSGARLRLQGRQKQ